MQHQDVAVWAQSVSAAAGAVLKADGLDRPSWPRTTRPEICQVFLYDRHDALVNARIVQLDSLADIPELIQDLAADNPRVRSVAVWRRGRCIDWRLTTAS